MDRIVSLLIISAKGHTFEDYAKAEEQQWVTRIILEGTHRRQLFAWLTNGVTDMIISLKETTILSVLHPDAQDLFNICSDLKKVAYELWDPSYRLNAEVCFTFQC